MKKLLTIVLLGLLLSGSAYAVDVHVDAVWTVTNDIDVIIDPNSPGALDPNFIMAINCGRGVCSGAVITNPYVSGDGEDWGSIDAGDYDLVVNGVTFYNDMWSTVDEARNYNYESHDSVTDQDLFSWGSGDEWRFKPERGALYHGVGGGNDDGGISWLANYQTGSQDGGTKNKIWHAPYEGTHDHNPITLVGYDSTSIDNFSKILRRSGTNNAGNYDSGMAMGERDSTFDFAVDPGHTYNVKVVPYKNIEDSNVRVEINGVLVLDKLVILSDIDPSTEFGFVSYDVTTGGAQSIIQVKVGRATDSAGHNMADVSMIIVEDLGADSDVSPAVLAGDDVLIDFFGVPVDYTLQGVAYDPEAAAGFTSGWTASPSTVTFDDASSPTAIATFSAEGVYTLTLTGDDGTNAAVTDDVVITVKELSVLPVMNYAVSIVTNNIDDIVPVGLDPNDVMAINCGRGVYSGNPTGNPYAAGDSSLWGNLDAGDYDLVVNGITFYNDMWNTSDEARNWNKNVANVGSDRDVFGDEDDWRFRVERGALYHGIGGGSNDGGIAWLGNHLGGTQDDGRTPPRNQPEWQCGYEGTHDHSTPTLTGADSGSVTNFAKILRRAGTSNAGNYDVNKAEGERDMLFDFAVEGTHQYRITVVPYKNNGENSCARVQIDGVMVLDNFHVDSDIDKNVEFGAVQYTKVTDVTQTILRVTVGRGSNNDAHNMVDVSLIMVEDLGEVTNLPAVAGAGDNDYTWFDGGVAEQVLEGSGTDNDGDTLSYKWTANSGDVSFVNDEDPTTTAVFANSGVYTLTLEVRDGFYPAPSVDSVVITVYDDACASAKAQGVEMDMGDITGVEAGVPDCVTDLLDMAALAASWLNSTAATK